MKLGEQILKILGKTYQPSSLINSNFKGYDIAIKTNEEGQPILLFMGKMTDRGTIKGELFARNLKKDEEGRIIKDHWVRKGKAG